MAQLLCWPSICWARLRRNKFRHITSRIRPDASRGFLFLNYFSFIYRFYQIICIIHKQLVIISKLFWVTVFNRSILIPFHGWSEQEIPIVLMFWGWSPWVSVELPKCIFFLPNHNMFTILMLYSILLLIACVIPMLSIKSIIVAIKTPIVRLLIVLLM
jgi:hypothetical protein